MKNFICSPWASICFCLVGFLFLATLSFLMTPREIIMFCDIGQTMDVFTYTGYALCLIVLLYFASDFRDKKFSYICFIYIWLAAVLREMGIQHWIPSQDTTAFKLRFFTNPNNPVEEKILAALLLLSVFCTVIYLLWKYVSYIWYGFWKQNGLAWTMCCFAGLGIVCKFADRFPSNYFKSTGVRLDNKWFALFNLVEEGFELLLPLIIILALFQYHLIQNDKN